MHVYSMCVILCLATYTVHGRHVGSCSGITFVTRAQWGAREPKSTADINVPVPEFFVHHTDTHECFNISECCAMMRGIQDFHMDVRKWDDIGYNFLVGEDGNVYEGRGWTHVGAQVKGYNSKSFGTSIIGNYMKILPNVKALSALKSLLECGVELGNISPKYRLYGHRDAGHTTDCPGDVLYSEIRRWPHYSHEPPQHASLLAFTAKSALGARLHSLEDGNKLTS
uniref:Peptidoglycan-recognition protein n=1 Tax=Archivesica packardana TaxID=1299447 RepID=A0A344TAZ6_9BIVA|nr:peptidoglycan recognition protein 2 [Archivesica packardana]